MENPRSRRRVLCKVVRADAIATARRDETGKAHLTLREHKGKRVASRLCAHRFKAR